MRDKREEFNRHFGNFPFSHNPVGHIAAEIWYEGREYLGLVVHHNGKWYATHNSILSEAEISQRTEFNDKFLHDSPMKAIATYYEMCTVKDLDILKYLEDRI